MTTPLLNGTIEEPTATIVERMQMVGKPVAIVAHSERVAVVVPPELFEELMAGYDAS